MSVAASVWCISCGRAPELTLTLERDGVLMHYGSCWDHVIDVAIRAQADVALIDRRREQALRALRETDGET